MPRWTKEQEQAINEDGNNIIVSAGAGSGKTAVLTARVIRKLNSGVDINRLLVLTFTNEAASEMKDRIRSSIEKEERLKKQLDFIDQAYITTFDSYALSIVKKYHYLLGVSKNIGIVDSSIINILKKQYLEEIILKRYEEKDNDFLKLVGDFCVKDDKKIYELILGLSAKLDLRYDKKEYLRCYIDNFYNDDYFSLIFNDYLKFLDSKINLIKNLLYEISIKVDGDIYSKYSDALSNLVSSNGYMEIKDNLISSLPTVRNTSVIDKEKDAIKGILKELSELTIYDDINDIKNIYYSTMPYVKAIISIILELDSRIDMFKKDKSSFEFVDISKMAIKVVRDNLSVREELKSYYNEIMVDEYQDTNDLQEMFISCIATKNVYMVGDIKQSIYRFRNANPSIFKEKYESYASGDGGIKIDLLKNFRSRGEVLDDINILFDKVMDAFIGGADYKVSHRMVFGNDSYILDGKNDLNHNLEIYNYSDEDKSFSKAEKEIFIIADDIKKKINSNYTVMDKKSGVLRNITYSDFCIILDRGKEFSRYKKIFEYLGIPLSVYEDEKLTVEYDVFVLKNLFSLILMLNDGVYVNDKKFLYCFTSVLRSFLFGVNDDDIFVYLNELDKLKESNLYIKCKEISKMVNEMTPVMLLDEIVNEFNFYEKLITAFDVDKAMIRLDYLKKIAINLENLGYTNHMFLEYLNSMVEDKDNDIKYKINAKSGNSVKLMNIHKSKGLEFPVCYFAGFYEKFNTMDLKTRFLYDNDYGIITPYFKDGIGSFISKSLYADKYYLEEISEKIRLFYVAVTRAREKMIIVTSLDDEDAINLSMVDDFTRINYRSFLDILNSIKFDLIDMIVDVDLNSIGMTKNYNLVKKSNYEEYIPKSNEKLKIKSISIDSKLIENKHFSKSSLNLVNKEEKLNMENGIRLHEIFEREDFLRPRNEFVIKFLNHNEIGNISDAKIYKEYEFMYDDNSDNYHGIIDLLLVYEDHALIIDYKMYHIVDDAYKKQLNGYKEYIEKKIGKPVKTYLYAIYPDVLEEIKQ